MTNDYKADAHKPPVLDAVLVPFRKTLFAVAAMAADMREKHSLAGSKDPYQEWRQLPDGKARLANAGARHAMNPWAVNTRDGQHLHILHAIWDLMAAHEKHLEEVQAAEADRCCGAADAAVLDPAHWAPLPVPAGADWRENTCGLAPVKDCICLQCTEPYSR